MMPATKSDIQINVFTHHDYHASYSNSSVTAVTRTGRKVPYGHRLLLFTDV
jgi:hypothetical protein